MPSRTARSGTGAAPGGARVVRTLLLSDVRGFTGIADRHPPDAVFQALSRCLHLQAGLVRAHRGLAGRFVGDSVTAVFDGDGMAPNALRCAIEIQSRLRDEDAAQPEAPRLRVGIGIVTGALVLGRVAGAEEPDFTIAGSTVRLGARLCARAGPGEVLIDPDTHARVDGRVAARPVDAVAIDGLGVRCPVYRIR